MVADMSAGADLQAHIPEGDLEEKWDNYKFETKLVNPANKRRFKIIVVGPGLAGASAAASLGSSATRSRRSRSTTHRAAHTASQRRVASTRRRTTTTTATA